MSRRLSRHRWLNYTGSIRRTHNWIPFPGVGRRACRNIFPVNAFSRTLTSENLQSSVHIGYLLNFGEDVMKTGITRCVNGLEE